MELPIWCVHCHRVWDGLALEGTWPYLICADIACNEGTPGTFMPYHQTRQLIAAHWPEVPVLGQVLALQRVGAPARHPDRVDPVLDNAVDQ